MREYDYSRDGVYFITICTQNREPILSEIVAGDGFASSDCPCVQLSQYGRIVEKYITTTRHSRANVTVDCYVIMPDHVHILLSVQNRKENGNETSLPVNAIIPQVVSGLKRLTGREIGFNIWQRSYYDHVIRGDEDYWNIRQYIEENPLRWVEKMKQRNGLSGV